VERTINLLGFFKKENFNANNQKQTGGNMIVKVIIKRDIREGKGKQFFGLLKNLRSNAILQEGYISGETLICAENKNRVLVISKWESLESWNNWKNNIKRKEKDASLSELQANPTIYEPYMFGRYKTDVE
jgi:heme-degrading monooxygenase HmoA